METLLNLGTCAIVINLLEVIKGDGRTNDSVCINKYGSNGFCMKAQKDSNFNGVGDACECESDFDCNGSVDGGDVGKFLKDLGRNYYNNPCNQKRTNNCCQYF